MAIHILDEASHAYLQGIGKDAEDTYDEGLDIARAAVHAALTLGNPVDAAAVHYLIDYFDDATDFSDGLGKLADWLYGSRVPLGVSTTDRAKIYLETLKGPISPELAPLFLLRSLSTYSTQPDLTYFGDLQHGLLNSVRQDQPPSADVIKAYGSAGKNAYDQNDYSGEFVLADDDYAKLGLQAHDVAFYNPWSGVPSYKPEYKTYTFKQIARAVSEYWMDYAADRNLRIDPKLIDAYIGLDPANGKAKLLELIQSHRGTNLSFPPDLLEAYRTYNPAGPAGPTSADGTPGYPVLSKNFDPAGHTVAGWSWLALASLLKGDAVSRPVDTAMLKNLDEADPWAGAYFRWSVVSKQVASGKLDMTYLNDIAEVKPDAAVALCVAVLGPQLERHETLDPAYLALIQTYDPQTAADLSMRSMLDGLQTKNRVVPPDGTSWGTSPRNVTGLPMPTIRVDLTGMGTTRPVVGSVLTMTIHGETVTFDKTYTPPALTQADVDRGYVDLDLSLLAPQPPAGTTAASSPTALGDGRYTVTSHFVTTGRTATGTTSATSAPLDLYVDTTPPALVTTSGRYDNFGSVVFKISDSTTGLADITPTPDQFTLSDAFGTLGVVGVTIDPSTNRIIVKGDRPFMLDANTAVDANTPAADSKITLSYTPKKGRDQIQDLAGNKLAGFNGSAALDVTAWTAVSGTTNVTPHANPRLQPTPRTLDLNTWQVLHEIDPVTAQQIFNDAKQKGLLKTQNDDVTEVDFEMAMITMMVTRAKAVEDDLRTLIQATQQKNEALSKLTKVMGQMNKVGAAIPSDTKVDENVANAIGSKFAGLASDLNKAITEAGIKPFKTDDGLCDSSLDRGAFEGALAELKSLIDAKSTDQQTDMFSMQRSTTARNESYSTVSALLERFASTHKGIIDKM